MTERVNVPVATGTVSLSGLARGLRTALQVIIAVGAAIPTILLTPTVAGNAVLVKDLGIVSGFIAVVVILQNALEASGIIPTIGGSAATKSTTITSGPVPGA